MAIAEAGCIDFDDNGTDDNAFSGIAGLANGDLGASVADGDINLMPVALGLDAPGTDGLFDLALLTADDDNGVYTVQPEALDLDGNARIFFPGAETRGGAMIAGPGDFSLTLPMQGEILDLRLNSTIISGTSSVNAQGLSISGGIIAGVISGEDFDAAMTVVPAEYQGLIGLFLQPDLDTDNDGTADAYSICLTFEAAGATVQGFPVE